MRELVSLILSFGVILTAVVTVAFGNEAQSDALRLDAPALSRLLREEHVAPFWLRGESEFVRVESDLRRSVASGARGETLLAQMLRLIAVVGDGHTVLASGDRYGQFGIAPFLAEIHDDGVFLVTVPESQRRALAAEVLAVGGVPLDTALGQLRSVVPHSTESRFRRWACSYLHLPGLLHALGLSDTPHSIELTLRLADGTVARESFPRTTLEGYRELATVSFTPAATLARKSPDARYWFEPLPDSSAVYFAFRRVASDREGESIWSFGLRLAAYLREHSVQRLIIDLRENGGGGYQYAAHLRPLLQAVPTLDHPGGIVVLTGVQTYSAASDFLDQLQRFTDATIVGLPPAARIGEPGDDDDFELPNSGLTVRISRIASRLAAGVDRRDIVEVDLLVPDAFADVRAGRDPAFEAALAYEPTLPPQSAPSPKWNGRFRFAPDADLVIGERAGRWRAAVLPQMDTPVTPVSPTRFVAALPGVTLVLEEGGGAVRMIRADGSEVRCPRKATDTPGAWELVFDGRVAEAEPLFRQSFEAEPDAPTLTDGSFSREAIHLVYTLRDRMGQEQAKLRARRLLELGIALHPEGAPESTFSLRFYPPPAADDE